MRTVLLTGASGFIGNKLARQLIARGDRLRCIVRSSERGEQLRRELGAEYVVCALTDTAALARAMQDCFLGYHLAAIYDVGVVDEGALQLTNVEGTRAMLDAAQRSGLPRLVYVSSTVALGPAAAGAAPPVREYDGPYPSVYHRTKAEAHGLAREAQERGEPVLIACPSFVYGPEDQGPGGRFVMDLLARRVPALLSNPGSFSYVHVDDVASGLAAVGERGQPGRTYVLSGENQTMNDFAAQVARLAGVKAPPLRFPAGMAAATGWLLDRVSRLTGWRFPITQEGVATTAKSEWLHSHAATTAELGWRPRSLKEGLPETIEWFRAMHQRTKTASSQSQ